MKKTLILLITAFLLINCGNEEVSVPCCNEKGENMIAAKLFDLGKSLNADSLQKEIKIMQKANVKQLFVLPRHVEVDGAAKILDNSGIDLWLIAQIFYNDDIKGKSAICDDGKIAKGTGNGSWLTMVCPNDDEYLENIIQYLKSSLSKCNFTGISLDFIRYFVFWEGVFENTDPNSLRNSCFCDICVSKFKKFAELTEIQGDNIVDIANNIKKNHLEEWTEFKCKTIDEKIEKILTDLRADFPNLKANMHAVPWKKNDFDGAVKKIAGQDFSLLSRRLDQISPMTYSKMLGRNGQWITDVVSGISGEISNENIKVFPAVQIQSVYGENFNETTDFKDIVKNAVKSPSTGVMIWQWEDLTEKQIEIINEL